jgi:hypothetical protein
MSCEHLVCAACAHPVSEGRCAVCQASRAEVHHHHRMGISGPTLALLLAALAALVLLAAHFGAA